MSRSEQHHHPSDRDAEALNAYLDQLTGANGEPAGGLSPELRQAVNRLFALAAVAGPLDEVAYASKGPSMTTASPMAIDVATALPRATPRRTTRPSSIRPLFGRWSRPLQLAATAAVVLLTVIAAFGAFRTMNQSGGDGEGFYGAVPLATVPADAVTSSIPHPTADECTATPRTREEVAEILRTPPPPNWSQIQYDDAPDRATADDVMATFREWQACMVKGGLYRFSAELMTEDAVRYQFYGNPMSDSPSGSPPPEPLSEDTIELILDDIEGKILGISSSGTPIPAPSPMATPSAADLAQGVAWTIFPDDLRFATPIPNTRPDSNQVRALAYWIDYATNEILIQSPQSFLFAEIDGRWLIVASWTDNSQG